MNWTRFGLTLAACGAYAVVLGLMDWAFREFGPVSTLAAIFGLGSLLMATIAGLSK